MFNIFFEIIQENDSEAEAFASSLYDSAFKVRGVGILPPVDLPSKLEVFGTEDEFFAMICKVIQEHKE